MALVTVLSASGRPGLAQVRQLKKAGYEVRGTTRNPEKLKLNLPSSWEILKFEDGQKIPELSTYLSKITHLITTISAISGYDPVIQMHSEDLSNYKGWTGYISATSVYPTQENGFIDETVPAAPNTKRGFARLKAEKDWQRLCNSEIFRVAGIYGPGRNAILALLEGRAQIIEKKGQLSNRIHQEDITNIVIAAIAKPRAQRIINLCDQEPAAQGDVVRYAAKLLGITPPEPIAFEKADLTPMARSFYTSKRKLKSVITGPELGVKLKYPNYRDGLKSLMEGEKNFLGKNKSL